MIYYAYIYVCEDCIIFFSSVTYQMLFLWRQCIVDFVIFFPLTVVLFCKSWIILPKYLACDWSREKLLSLTSAFLRIVIGEGKLPWTDLFLVIGRRTVVRPSFSVVWLVEDEYLPFDVPWEVIGVVKTGRASGAFASCLSPDIPQDIHIHT